MGILFPFFCGGPTVEVPLCFCFVSTFKREEKGRRSVKHLLHDSGERGVTEKRVERDRNMIGKRKDNSLGVPHFGGGMGRVLIVLERCIE